MTDDILVTLRLLVISEALKVARTLPYEHDLNVALRTLDRWQTRRADDDAESNKSNSV